MLHDPEQDEQLCDDRGQNELSRHLRVLHSRGLTGRATNGVAQDRVGARIVIESFAHRRKSIFGHFDVDPRLRCGEKPKALNLPFIRDATVEAFRLQEITEGLRRRPIVKRRNRGPQVNRFVCCFHICFERKSPLNVLPSVSEARVRDIRT